MSNQTAKDIWQVLKILPQAIILHDSNAQACSINTKAQQLLSLPALETVPLSQLSSLKLLQLGNKQHICTDLFFKKLIHTQSSLTVLLQTSSGLESLKIKALRYDETFTIICLEPASDHDESEYHFDKVISKISTQLIDIQSTDFDDQINYALKAIGIVCKADRSYLFKYHNDNLTMSNTHEWVNDGVESYIDELKKVPIASLPYFQHVLTNTHIFKSNDINELPSAAETEKATFVEQSIQSLICVGLSYNNKLIGFIGCDCVKQKHSWSKTDILRLKLVGEMIASAIKSINYQNKLEQTQLQLVAANLKLNQLVNTDKLTGIANRRGFDKALSSELQRCIRAKQSISLIMCDIDFFKLYNDNFGHQNGDRALSKVAKALNKLCKRQGDLAARYGGEEFAVILPDTNSEQCYQFAQMIRQSIAALAIAHPYSKVDQYLSLSLGFYSMQAIKGVSSKQLIKNADTALYHAKETGRNKIAQYNQIK